MINDIEKYDRIFEEAKNGGRHSGWYNISIIKNDARLIKSVISHENQVTEHKNKINNPAKYYSDWNNRTDIDKERYIQKWKKDMERNQEQAEIEKRIIKERSK